MTVVAAVTDGSTVWMAADTATNTQGRPVLGVAHKIRELQVGPWSGFALLGIAGDGGLARFAPLTLNEPEGDLDAWADGVASQLTEYASERGFIEDGRIDGSGLLGYAGRIWTLTHNQAVPAGRSYEAIGSGSDVAVGAMFALLGGTHLPPHQVAEAAALAATYLDYSCSEPIESFSVAAPHPDPAGVAA